MHVAKENKYVLKYAIQNCMRLRHAPEPPKARRLQRAHRGQAGATTPSLGLAVRILFLRSFKNKQQEASQHFRQKQLNTKHK